MHVSQRTQPENAPNGGRLEPVFWKLLVSAIWTIGFLWVFFCQDLPNNSTADNPIGRSEIWAAIWSNPFTLLNPLDYSWSDQRASWSHLSQRLPHLATALMIWASAWGWGHFLRRLLLNRFELSRSEGLVVDGGIGLSVVSLWVLLLSVIGHMNATSMLAPGYVLAAVAMAFRILQHGILQHRTQTRPGPTASGKRPPLTLVDWILCSAILVFGLHLFLGTFTPAWDFDVREYHLQGPKEWWQAGQVEALDHNVYTSFPFLSEMLSLLAMIIDADPWHGGISGKATLGAFSFLSVLAVFAISSRLFGRRSGLLGALILISTPWLLRISIIAYAESAITFYLIATVMVALRLPDGRSLAETVRLVAVIGFLAGSAMSSKYPGIVSAVIPIGCFVFWRTWNAKLPRQETGQGDEGHSETKRAEMITVVGIYGIAVLLAVGPWLIRNVSDTGNPVYPLVWSVFGGTDWDQSLNAKWKAAHSAPDHNLTAIPRHLKDVALKNDWQNGLLFALAIPVAVMMFRRKGIQAMILQTAWLLASWWLLTHRIDRFWVPMIPLLAVIASASWSISGSRAWHVFLLSTVLAASVFNYAFGRLDVIGFHVGLSDLPTASQKRVREDIRYLNAALPAGSRVLMVGEAEVFDCRFETVYNTVFDQSIFQDWTCSTKDVLAGTSESALLSMKPADQISARLEAEGVTHVYVNWLEILRYRQTYGYTPYVTPARFQKLVDSAVLLPGTVTAMGAWQSMPEQQQDEVQSWQGSEFLRKAEDDWTSRVLYRINPDFEHPAAE